jgi:hypothetical protein
MNDEIISNENVTMDLVRAYFDKAYFTTRLDDKGCLFIQDRFKIYIDISSRKTNITFSANFLIKEDASLEHKLDFANTINKELLQVKAVMYEKTITVEYDFWVEGGALVKNMVLAYRSFITQLSAALNKDHHKVLM